MLSEGLASYRESLYHNAVMTRRIFKTGNSLAVALPKDTLAELGLSEKAEVTITVDKRHRQIILRSAKAESKVDQAFASQVSAFIKRYRPALSALAKR